MRTQFILDGGRIARVVRSLMACLPSLVATCLITCGETVNGSLTSPGETDVYTFTVTAGEVVRFIAVSSARNYMEIYDSAANRVDAAENFLQTRLEAGGRYTLLFRANFPNQTLSYTFTFQQLRNPCGAAALNCGQTISGALGVTQTQLRTLNIAAGEVIRFIAVSDVRNYLELFDATERLLRRPRIFCRRPSRQPAATHLWFAPTSRISRSATP